MFSRGDWIIFNDAKICDYMRTTFIPDIFKSALNEQEFKVHQKKNSDMTF